MTIEKARRVVQRIRQIYGAEASRINILNAELEKAIMIECGTDRRTYHVYRKVLIKLGWISPVHKKRFRLTNNDI